MSSETAHLIERHVTLFISPDTADLWDAMTERLGFDCFDQTVQALTMVGAAALAQADLGVIDKKHLPIDPDQLRSIIWPWMRKTFGT